MVKLVERTFPAKELLKGLRSIGYSFSTAVADIIDNSVSARAKHIDIFSDPLCEDPYFCILDDGEGMDADELDNAMLFGSNRERKLETEIELGRFGLGLKSASLSQCRQFIVASKKFDEINAMCFNLDTIEQYNKLFLQKLNKTEIKKIPHIDNLIKHSTGTIVVWKKFDKIKGSAKKFEDTFRSLVAESKKHVELVFHRFYDSIEINYDNKRIEERDPFLLSSHGRQQTGRTKEIFVDGAKIIVTPYTLPYAKTLTEEEKSLLGNPKSIFDEQGLYLYRNKRLISWGSWMRMGARSELNKLARVQIDIPSQLDAVWTLDVKKSSANIPDKVKEQIRIAIEDSIVRSKRTTRFPGAVEQSADCKVWNRINEHEGKIKYSINRELPAIKALYNCLGENEQNLLNIALSQIECYLPKYSISNDTIDDFTIINSDTDTEENHLIDEVISILKMVDENKKQVWFDQIFISEGYQKIAKYKEDIRRKVFEQ